MKIIKALMLLCFVGFSITKSYGVQKTDSLYKVLKIKEKGDYYVIIAQRNDSLFKIISKKISPDKKPDLECLKKGKSYYFDFGKVDSTTIESERLVGIANYLHVTKSRFWGDTKIKFTKRFHYRLYTTKNLIGLYYSP